VRIVICPDSDCVSYYASRQVVATVQRALATKQQCVLALPTGSTPLPLYGHLIAAFYDGEVDFSRVHTLNLDEYVGLVPNHPQSYRYFMTHHFFRYVNIPLRQTHVPNGLARDLEAECARYERLVESLGIDIAIVGIGQDGHVAFNEPGSPRDSRTRRVRLTESTIRANARFFGRAEDVPREALTMGLSTILDHSEVLILVATGEEKARPLAEALFAPMSDQVPASYLRGHANCTFYVDRWAARDLQDRIAAGELLSDVKVIEASETWQNGSPVV